VAAAIVATGVGKRFRRFPAGRPDTLKDALLNLRWLFRPAEYFWSLREVSFTVERGHTIGVLGKNGAGKSTLLRLLAGIGKLDEGRVEVHGRVSGLLELGAGFHPDLTGRENVYVNGVIGGCSRREIDRRFASIVEFAELAEFIDSPLRTYSNGMQMRLAFAVAIHAEPEILLIDEVLSVGDIGFQKKCLDRIAEIKQRGCTIVLVTHDDTMARRLCDQVLWLRAGRLVADGPAEEVADRYVSQFADETQRRTPQHRAEAAASSGIPLRMNENRFGSQEVQIAEVRLLDSEFRSLVKLRSGAAMRVEIDYVAQRPVEKPIFGIEITTADGSVCCKLHDEAVASRALPAGSRGTVAVQFERLDLGAGSYFVNAGVYQSDWDYTYDYHYRTYPLQVGAGETQQEAPLHPPHRWESSTLEPQPARSP